MINPEKSPNAQYTGVKVTSMLKALKSREINKHLALKRKNVLSLIDNKYKVYGSLDAKDMYTLWKLYYNFVVMDYRDISTI